jgi:protein-tyrosine phosphatase
MLPLVDVHCHLLAGLDDGPRTWDDAVAMCRIAHQEGTQMIAATAHQNERWSAVTPELIKDATRQLAEKLQEANIPLTVLPTAEIMAHADMEDAWTAGRLLSLADRKRYLLVEMPHGLVVDVLPTVEQMAEYGLRIILAHPERHPEWLHDAGRIEELIAAGCLVQVSSGSITRPRSSADRRSLRDWFRRGVVHLLGSDGHSPRSRAPLMRAAYEQVAAWAGRAMADRVGSVNGVTVMQGLPLSVPHPRPRRAWWLPTLW